MLKDNNTLHVLQRSILSIALLIAGLMLVPVLTNAQSLPKSKVGKGIQYMAADTSFAVKMNIRFQTLYAGEFNYDTEDYADALLIRRARLKFEGFAYSPNLEYKLELGLSNRDTGGGNSREFRNTSNIILDAVVRWEFAPNWSVWFGQTKLPGNRERVISSQKLQFVDRSLLNAAYNIDRDAGVQLHHVHSLGGVIFREAAAISLGEGRNFARESKGGYDYTARIEMLPFGDFTGSGDYFGADLAREKTPKLSIGATYDYNDRATREGGQLGAFLKEERTLKSWFADAMFKYQGFSMMAEYAKKEAAGSPVITYNEIGLVEQAFRVGTGFNIQAGYLFRNNVEVAGRYTTIDPNALTDRPDQKQYTLGLSKYVSGHTIKVQSDISLLRENNENSEFMYRFQVEMGF